MKNIPICIYPFLKYFQNIPIVRIPIISRNWKYTHMPYTHYFVKMGIFQNFHIPKKKTGCWRAALFFVPRNSLTLRCRPPTIHFFWVYENFEIYPFFQNNGYTANGYISSILKKWVYLQWVYFENT